MGKAVPYYYIKNDDIKTKGGDANAAISHVTQLCDQVEALAENNLVVLFFDEFDGIVTKREELSKKNTTINFQNNDLNTILLQKLEHLRSKKNIIILAATNHIENLDDAGIRDGRFDHKLLIGKPNVEMRTEILEKIPVEQKSELTEEEKNLLLHLTSSQTTVSVSKTIKQYMEYKKKNAYQDNNEEANEGEEANEDDQDDTITQFIIESFNAQNKRLGGSCSQEEEKTKEWINKSKQDIEELKETESKNPEIVSIKDIENQAKFPSLQFDIQGLLVKERLNETEEQKLTKQMIKSLDDIREALTDNSKDLSASLEDITSRLHKIVYDIDQRSQKSYQTLGKIIENISKGLEGASRALEKIISTSELNARQFSEKTIFSFEKVIKELNELGYSGSKIYSALAESLKSQEEELKKLVTIFASEQITKQASRDILKHSILYLNLVPEISGRDAYQATEVKLNDREKNFLTNSIDTLLRCMEDIGAQLPQMEKKEMGETINKLFWSLSYYFKHVNDYGCCEKINFMLQSDKYTQLFTIFNKHWEDQFLLSGIFNWIQGSTFFRKIQEAPEKSTAMALFIKNIENMRILHHETTSVLR